MPKCNGIPLLNIPYDPNYNKTGKEPSVDYYLLTQHNVTLAPLPYIPTRPTTSTTTTAPATPMTITTTTTTTKPTTVRTAPTKSTPTTPTTEAPKVTQSAAEATTSAAMHNHLQFWGSSICFSSIILYWGQDKSWL
ncbi:hypothetical protein RvY_06464 [Ramazzottius varieornatus]|uniref:Uncharacterized protein n=1 Tax=Ramazzottius varieornatus TaxID=947166 RepID=A0A1D1UZ52_RAMVA|nr:hypothetical protein RvY_06464 [Ramazzottius varieornatus]